MRRFRALPVMLIGLSVGLTGRFKSTRLVQKTQAPDVYRTASVEALQKEISDRDAAIKTLNASVLITASTGGGKEGRVTTYTSFKGYIFVRKPRDLNVIMLLPVIGSRALDMVSDGKNFTLLIPPQSRAIVGTNEVTKPSKNGLENLRPGVFFDSLLVPGVGPDEFVSLSESTRVVPRAKHQPALEEPDYDLAVLRKKSGNILQLSRLIHISRVDMLPFRQDIYDEQARVVTMVTYDKYQMFSGQMFPTATDIKRPLDEYELKVDITKLTLNDELDDDQFEVPKIPAGYKVQRVE